MRDRHVRSITSSYLPVRDVHFFGGGGRGPSGKGERGLFLLLHCRALIIHLMGMGSSGVMDVFSGAS